MSTTLLNIIAEAAGLSGHCFASTAGSTADSTHNDTTHLWDAALADSGVDAAFLQGAWVLRPNAVAAGDQVRRIASGGFNVTNSQLTVSRAWANDPHGEAYYIFTLAPPIAQPGLPFSWAKAVNEGFIQMPVRQQIVLGQGTANGQRRYSLNSIGSTFIAVIAVAGGSAATITAPSGWTLIKRTNNSTVLALATYSYSPVASDSAQGWAWTFDTSRAAAGAIVEYIDTQSWVPIDVSVDATGSGATGTASTLTTTKNNDIVLYAYATAVRSEMALDSSIVKRVDAMLADHGTNIGLAAGDVLQTTIGAASALAATFDASETWAAQTIALFASPDTNRRPAFNQAMTANNGSGATTLTILKPSDVLPNADWHMTEATVRHVFVRTNVNGIVYDIDQQTQGNFWRFIEDGLGNSTIELSSSPTVDQTVIAEVMRPYPSLSALTDQTDCPLELAAAAAKYRMFRYLNGQTASAGQYQAELKEAMDQFIERYRPYRPRAVAILG